MVPVLAPVLLGREILACLPIGAAAGCLRGFFPARGRGAFLPDMLLAGWVLFATQSYAAGQSCTGVLRWYMVAACFCGALAADRLVGTPLRAAGRRMAGWYRQKRRLRRKNHRKQRRNAETTAENAKKNLPNRRIMMYNSNVS